MDRAAFRRAAKAAKEVYRAERRFDDAIREALRPGDVISYQHGNHSRCARVMSDYEDGRRAYLSSGGGPHLLRVKVASLEFGSNSEYWLHVIRIQQLQSEARPDADD